MVAQVVEYVLGKDGVPGSSPGLSGFQTLNPLHFLKFLDK